MQSVQGLFRNAGNLWLGSTGLDQIGQTGGWSEAWAAAVGVLGMSDPVYVEFADLAGSHPEVSAVCSGLLSGDYLVREDAFTRNGVEVHRVYVTDYEMYETLRPYDTFSPIEKPVTASHRRNYSMIRASKRRRVSHKLEDGPDYQIRENGLYFVGPRRFASLQMTRCRRRSMRHCGIASSSRLLGEHRASGDEPKPTVEELGL